MESYKSLLNVYFLLCVVLISSAYGFLSGEYCASLFSTWGSVDGDTFNLTEGSSISSLQDAYVTSKEVWNVTSSFQVKPGCTLKACNDSYFDGECRDFSEGFTTLPESFKDILSVSCSCPRVCKCEDVNNIRRTSCARAYLSDGGCNNCTSYYTDLSHGDTDEFPFEFESKVSALMVRPGCNLIVHDQPFLGGSSNSVTNIVEKWTEPVKSYRCSCPPYDPNTTVVERKPKAASSDYPPLIDIPDSFDEINAMMNSGFANHPGLIAALKSNRRKRSTKNAYILLLGTTGAGKSSTINMLFDNPNVTKVGEVKSTTKKIHEFTIPIAINELGIKNSNLRVIDTPGLGDTEGIDKDARFLATLEEFLDAHEELKDRIPNIVLIFHKFSDNRFGGHGSQFVRMIRGLDSFRKRITDSKFSNVIFVFSHFTSESKSKQRNPARKLTEFKKTIEDYTKFPRPIVMAVAENKPQEQSLLMINGYYKLPNGDYYPKNLFDKMTQVTQAGGDSIGDTVIRSAFRIPDDFNISSTDFSIRGGSNNKISKYMGILSLVMFNPEMTELSRNLTVASESMDPELQRDFPDALSYLQKTLNIENFRTAADLPKTTTGIVKLLSELKLNDAVLYLLKKGCGISPPVFKEKSLTGYSYNVFKDQALPVSPFDLRKLQNCDIGYQFPALFACNVDFRVKDILHFFSNQKDYLDERIRSLNIGGKIAPEKFTGAIKKGYNLLSNMNSPEESNLTAFFTAVREIRSFELVLNDKYDIDNLTEEFKKSVRSLTPCNASDPDSVNQWNSFFNEYGTHVVKSIYGGGAIEIEMKTRGLNNLEIAGALMSIIQFAEDISLGKRSNSSIEHEGSEHSLNFVGGNQNYHTTDITRLPLQTAAELLEKWQESLILSPAILMNEMKLIPLSEIARKLGQNFSTEINKATELIFESKLVYNPPPHPSTLLPEGDRQSTQLVQTTNMFTMFMERMMNESRKSDERFHELMRLMQEERQISEERRIASEAQQFERMQQQREAEAIRRNDEFNMTLTHQKLALQNSREDAKLRENMENSRRMADRAHHEKLAALQREASVQQSQAMAEMVKNIPAPVIVCLRGGTMILMDDFTEKRVEDLEIGEMVLDYNLTPVRINGVLEKLLGNDSFYGFDDESFFFTDTHQFMGRSINGKPQIFVKDLNKTFFENPLLAYLGVQAFPVESEILQYNTKSKTVLPREVSVFTDPIKHPPTTPVFMVMVAGESGTYFANGFVSRHDIPPLQHWPNTLSILFSLASEPEIKKIENVPYNLETVEKIQNIVNGGYVRLQEILEIGEDGSKEDGVAPEGLSLSDKVISEIFNNPTFSSFAVGIYGRLGPRLAEKLDVEGSIRSELQIQRLRQFVVYEGLKEYFVKAFSDAF